MLKFLSNLFDSNEKQLNKAKPIIDKINSYEEYMSTLTDEQLLDKTKQFRETLGVDLEKARSSTDSNRDIKKINKQPQLDKEKEELFAILPEAFAAVREASKRVANHRHYDVQALAGYFLFTNKVVELFTGEGKTLAANMPLYLYALTGKGAHLVTVNDYLARRDAEWDGHILHALGITVASVNNDAQYRFISDEEAIKIKGSEAKKLIAEREALRKAAGRLKYDHMNGANLIECTKKEAYACDVVYGTNNEFGFDYLRDNMARDLEDRVQGPLHYVIVDEADSILIDEARTPLIISQSAQESNELYSKFAAAIANLTPEVDYTIDEKAHSTVATDEGLKKIEKAIGVANIYEDPRLAYHLDNALKAQGLYKLDDEYIVRNGEVFIVDEFTGRVLQGRRYSEGLHQAIEAKEKVEIKRESRTLATITLQNYFRLYDFMSGMTGTALTEAEEFANIYKLDTIVVPTNRPVVRKDNADVVYRTQAGKFKAIVEEIKARHEKGQPVLVGTTSVEKSEIIAEMLEKDGIAHNVLNAKFHDREAKVVAEAGQKGVVTIATNMAGRGTDIALGEGVKELGGLYIIGSERHESRRIDNQLRGRSGRQGDPGESQFFVSFEDDLMRIFGGENMKMLMSRVGMDDDMPISSGILGKTIETAQKRVEAYNYDIRKHLVEYDDVLNQQREIVYGMRRRLLKQIKQQTLEVSKAPATQEKQITKEGQVQIKLNQKEIQVIDVDRLVSQVDEATNTIDYESGTLIEMVSELEKFPTIVRPGNMYILKKIFDHVRFIFSSQLSDDMKIDNSEERKTIAQIKSLLSEDLTEVSAKLMGFASSTEFFKEFDQEKNISKKENYILRLIVAAFIFHTSVIGEEPMVELAKMLVLQSLDTLWMEHLDTMGDLREGIGLRGMAQRDPLVEYKNEGFRMFDNMLASVDEGIVTRFFKVRLVRPGIKKGAQEAAQEVKAQPVNPFGNRGRDNRPGETGAKQKQLKNVRKVGRNDPCPCGSGKKYKKCCYPKYGG